MIRRTSTAINVVGNATWQSAPVSSVCALSSSKASDGYLALTGVEVATSNNIYSLNSI